MTFGGPQGSSSIPSTASAAAAAGSNQGGSQQESGSSGGGTGFFGFRPRISPLWCTVGGIAGLGYWIFGGTPPAAFDKLQPQGVKVQTVDVAYAVSQYQGNKRLEVSHHRHGMMMMMMMCCVCACHDDADA